MPLPVNKTENNFQVDYSFLLDGLSHVAGKSVMVSDKDADLLMKIWSGGKTSGCKTYKVSSDICDRDFSRLKSNGLINGNTDSFELTEKGKKVITVMTLGESNNFLKNQKRKNYTEILASNNKRGKPGYRIAERTDSGMEIKISSCKVNVNGDILKMSFSEWVNLGKKCGWVE